MMEDSEYSEDPPSEESRRLQMIAYEQHLCQSRRAEEMARARLFALQRCPQLTVDRAVAYFQAVMEKMGHLPQYWNEFEGIVDQMNRGSDFRNVILRVSRLFSSFPDLLRGFETFIAPPFIHLLYSDDSRPKDRKHISDRSEVPSAGESQHPNVIDLTEEEAGPSYSRKIYVDLTEEEAGPSTSRKKDVGLTEEEAGPSTSRKKDVLEQSSQKFQHKAASITQTREIDLTVEQAGPSTSKKKDMHGTSFQKQSQQKCQSVSFSRSKKGMSASKGVSKGKKGKAPMSYKGSTSMVENAKKIVETSEPVPTPENKAIFEIGKKYPRCGHLDDSSIASVSKIGSYEELRFFDKVKKALGYQEVYDNFLKCIDLYNEDVVTRQELVNVVTPFLGKFPELLKELQDILKLPESGEGIEYVPSKLVYLKNVDPDSSMEIDYVSGRRSVASYRPSKIYPPEKCSGRTALCNEVLNDTWVSFPAWFEESTCRPSVKTQYEESMYRIEDERFELDMAIQMNCFGINLLETVQKRMEKMTDEERAKFTLDDTLGGNSAVLVRKFLQRIYGEKTKELIEGLKRNPVVAVPIVLNRLKVRDNDWKDVQKKYNEIWREQVKSIYPKALDHKGITFKQTDSKNLRPKTLINEIETLYEEKKQKILEGSAGGFSEPHITLPLRTEQIFKDAVNLLLQHIKRQPGIYKDDRQGIGDLLTNFILDIFGIEFNASDYESDPKKDNGSASAHSSDGQCDEDVEVIESIQVTKKKDVSSRLERTRSRRDTRRAIINKSAKTDLPYSLFFVNSSWYVFFRLLFILLNRLGRLYKQSKKLEEEATEILSNTPSTSTAEVMPPPPSPYKTLLTKTGLFLAGKMDSSSFEDEMRAIFTIHAYVSYTFDKVIQGIVKQMHQLTVDEVSKTCTVYCIEHAEDISVHGVNPLTVKSYEEGYKKRAVRFLGDENCYKIVWHKVETTLTIELLDPGREILDEPSEVEKFSDYLDNYLDTDASNSSIKITTPYLKRNLKKMMNIWWSRSEEHKENEEQSEDKQNENKQKRSWITCLNVRTKKDHVEEAKTSKTEKKKVIKKGKEKTAKLETSSKGVKIFQEENKTIKPKNGEEERPPSLQKGKFKRVRFQEPIICSNAPISNKTESMPVKKLRSVKQPDSEEKSSAGFKTQKEASAESSVKQSELVPKTVKPPAPKKGRRKRKAKRVTKRSSKICTSTLTSEATSMDTHEVPPHAVINQSNEGEIMCHQVKRELLSDEFYEYYGTIADTNVMNKQASCFVATIPYESEEIVETNNPSNDDDDDDDEDSIKVSADDLLFHLEQTGMGICERYSDSFGLKSSTSSHLGNYSGMVDAVPAASTEPMPSGSGTSNQIFDSRDMQVYVAQGLPEFPFIGSNMGNELGSIYIAPMEQEIASSVEVTSVEQDTIHSPDANIAEQPVDREEMVSPLSPSLSEEKQQDAKLSVTREGKSDERNDDDTEDGEQVSEGMKFSEEVCRAAACKNLFMQDKTVCSFDNFTYKMTFAVGFGDLLYRRGALFKAKKSHAQLYAVSSGKFNAFHKVWLDRYVTPNMLKCCHLWMIRSDFDKFEVNCVTVNDHTKPPYAPYTKYFIRYFKRNKSSKSKKSRR